MVALDTGDDLEEQGRLPLEILQGQATCKEIRLCVYTIRLLHVMVSASDIIVLQILDWTTFFNVSQGETGFKKVEKMNNVLIH